MVPFLTTLPSNKIAHYYNCKRLQVKRFTTFPAGSFNLHRYILLEIQRIQAVFKKSLKEKDVFDIGEQELYSGGNIVVKQNQ